MSMILQTEYSQLKILNTRPISLEINFDNHGKHNFPKESSLQVQLAIRHAIGDLCEYRTGLEKPWKMEEKNQRIYLYTETYDVFKEMIEITPEEEKAEIRLRYHVEFLKDFDAHEMGTVMLRPLNVPDVPVVYISGRQGVCPLQDTVQREVLVDYKVPIAGWIQKCLLEQSLWITSDDDVKAIADWVRGEDGTWVGLSARVVDGWQYANYPATHTAWPVLLKFQKGTQIEFTAGIMSGKLCRADKKELILSGHTDFLGNESCSGHKYVQIAEGIHKQANAKIEDGGLWDDDEGCFIGCRDMSGTIKPEGGHETFGNLVAIGMGLCCDMEKQKRIIDWLDMNKELIYYKNEAPMLHATVPYTGWNFRESVGVELELMHSVPWICGWDIRARYMLGGVNKSEIWKLFLKNFYTTDYPFVEGVDFGKSIEEEQSNRGRIWDSWGFTSAIWNVHLGIKAELGHLTINPHLLDDNVQSTYACIKWQGHRYEIWVKGKGDKVASILVNNIEWISCAVPPFDAKVEVELGWVRNTPWIERLDPEMSICSVKFDHLNKVLSVELSQLSGKDQMFEISVPSGWKLINVKIGGAKHSSYRFDGVVRYAANADDRVNLEAYFEKQE